MPVVCLKGPKAVGKTSPARCLAGALGRVCAQVDCAELVDAGALLRERLNVVEVPGYLPEEKAVIAVEHLLPGARRRAEGDEVQSRSLGNLMRESARAAMSWVHANAGRYGVDAAVFRETDFARARAIGRGAEARPLGRGRARNACGVSRDLQGSVVRPDPLPTRSGVSRSRPHASRA